jgi:hypothetical protein
MCTIFDTFKHLNWPEHTLKSVPLENLVLKALTRASEVTFCRALSLSLSLSLCLYTSAKGLTIQPAGGWDREPEGRARKILYIMYRVVVGRKREREVSSAAVRTRQHHSL